MLEDLNLYLGKEEKTVNDTQSEFLWTIWQNASIAGYPDVKSDRMEASSHLPHTTPYYPAAHHMIADRLCHI